MNTEGFAAVRKQLKPGMQIAIRQHGTSDGLPRPPYRVETIKTVSAMIETQEGATYSSLTGVRLSNDSQEAQEYIGVDWITTSDNPAAKVGHYKLTPVAEVPGINELQQNMLYAWAIRKQLLSALSGPQFNRFELEQLEQAAAALGLNLPKLPQILGEL